jgi:hypothetical protein
MIRITFAIICVPVFALMFIWFGMQRVLGAMKSDKPGEAIFWGSVGILLGLAFIGGAVWLVVTPASPTD